MLFELNIEKDDFIMLLDPSLRNMTKKQEYRVGENLEDY
jgi:hypothetical protein